MNPAVITKVIIKRFRSFPAATLTFENPLFVVGRNGSGKSNLADVFSFVSEAMVSPLQAVFDRKGDRFGAESQFGEECSAESRARLRVWALQRDGGRAFSSRGLNQGLQIAAKASVAALVAVSARVMLGPRLAF